MNAVAVVPEQIVSYVTAVSGATPRRIGACIGYVFHRRLVLIGYPLENPFDEKLMETALEQALGIPGLETISVIGPSRPANAPADATVSEDAYYALPLPAPKPAPKLASLLRRAAGEISLTQERRIEKEHQALVQQYLDTRQLAPGTRHIFKNLSPYLETSKSSLIISARYPDGRLAAFGVAEYASPHTAMFIFCFRDKTHAPSGSADLALYGLLEEAQRRGHTRMNLGLGVNDGIRFFKRKWGAEIFLPCIETTWEISKPSVLSTVLGLLKKLKD